MEIHRYEQIWIAASLLIIVFFIASIVYGAVAVGVEMVDDKGGTVDPSGLNEHPEFSDPGVRRSGPNSYDAYVVARRFQFQPGTNPPITVPAGSRVTFHVTSPDVLHGFSVAGTNVNVMVIPGQTATVTAWFNQTGSYGIICNEYCGAAHHAMEGRLDVVPQSEYNASEAQ